MVVGYPTLASSLPAAIESRRTQAVVFLVSFGRGSRFQLLARPCNVCNSRVVLNVPLTQAECRIRRQFQSIWFLNFHDASCFLVQCPRIFSFSPIFHDSSLFPISFPFSSLSVVFLSLNCFPVSLFLSFWQSSFDAFEIARSWATLDQSSRASALDFLWPKSRWQRGLQTGGFAL